MRQRIKICQRGKHNCLIQEEWTPYLHPETFCYIYNLLVINTVLLKKIHLVTSGMVVCFSALRRVKPMEAALYKASRVFNNCPAIATKLRAMNYNAEEQVQAQKNQAAYLMRLAARTTPKGLHCLSMRLTSEYFALAPEKRQMPNQQNHNDPNLNHYVVFSDNVLASGVVVNSTIASSKVNNRTSCVSF